MKKTALVVIAALLVFASMSVNIAASGTKPYLTNNIPEISLPGVAQESFADAFSVLEEAVTEASDSNQVYGFNYPFCGPGGAYGACWWQLDTSLATAGAKWTNQKFAENVLRGFMNVQRENGRIPLHGPDTLLSADLKCSSLPKLFRTAYEILERTDDPQLIRDTYSMLKKYLDWWLTERRSDNGLILGIVEEWLPGSSEFTIQVETNVEVVEGCCVVSKLADYLGHNEDSEKYRKEGESLKEAINKYMWDEKNERYISLTQKGRKSLQNVWSVASFDVLRLEIADPQHIDALLKDLTDDSLFQWDTRPLTSAAKTDKQYNETKGNYAACQWYGSIWSMRNYTVVDGLEDIGRYDLAAYLALRTVELFDGNYAEFLDPPDGSGQGVLRYSWSASDYIQLIIEHIFGINYDNFSKTLTIAPVLDESLRGQTISLKNVLLPDGGKLSVTIRYETDAIIISYEASGAKDFEKVIAVPSYGAEYVAVGRETVTEAAGTYGTRYSVNNQKRAKGEIIFAEPSAADKYEALLPDGADDTDNNAADEPGLSGVDIAVRVFPCVFSAGLLIFLVVFIIKERKNKK
ncbi:MAG: hypothetical protein J5950_06335 [Clostridia bacterium]|nr:hypothetical protein [Clostridia bacterium]